MKNIYLLVILVALVSVSTFEIVRAEKIETDIYGREKVEVKLSDDKSTSTEDRKDGDENKNDKEDRASTTASSTASSTKDNDKDDQGKNDENNNDDNNDVSETHRSVVANFVKSLLSIAGREGGIGLEVREVARAQNDSATTTAEAVTEVEKRGSIRTFFFGSDYDNLGVIRAEIVKTSKNIEKLKTLLDKTVTVSDRAELSLQITALEAEQVKLEAYIKTHEDTFSLFGWFVKLF